MYTDQTIPFSSLLCIILSTQVRSGAEFTKIKVNVFENYSDENLNLCVDLGQIRLFVFVLCIAV